ncbi:hypothetical protein AOQ84DRAFT_376256 [Glonium stellatum]|uniref:NmrA-like domain-containing protein n=1 Tax=Glonium stellatum TaxID=574774 RepID=A0A8E2F1Q9_9PEZI|nr:hypothetical protein AOQ84DRAFT_376256 [Glonium stellatum]
MVQVCFKDTSYLNVVEQYRFIDAAIAAGIKCYVPSEYGLNNLNPKAAWKRDSGWNRGLVRVSDFAVSQVELFEAVERLTLFGERWMMETVSSDAIIKDAKEQLMNGDGPAVHKLIETGLVTSAL